MKKSVLILLLVALLAHVALAHLAELSDDPEQTSSTLQNQDGGSDNGAAAAATQDLAAKASQLEGELQEQHAARQAAEDEARAAAEALAQQQRKLAAGQAAAASNDGDNDDDGDDNALLTTATQDRKVQSTTTQTPAANAPAAQTAAQNAAQSGNNTVTRDDEHEELSSTADVDADDEAGNATSTSAPTAQVDAIHAAFAEHERDRAVIEATAVEAEDAAKRRHRNDTETLQREVTAELRKGAEEFERVQSSGTAEQLPAAARAYKALSDRVDAARAVAQTKIDAQLQSTLAEVEQHVKLAMTEAQNKFLAAMQGSGVALEIASKHREQPPSATGAPSSPPTSPPNGTHAPVSTNQALRSAVDMLLGVKETQEKQNKQPIFLSVASSEDDEADDEADVEMSQSTLALIVGAIVMGILLLSFMIWWLSSDAACCASGNVSKRGDSSSKQITDEDRQQAASVHAALLAGGKQSSDA